MQKILGVMEGDSEDGFKIITCHYPIHVTRLCETICDMGQQAVAFPALSAPQNRFSTDLTLPTTQQTRNLPTPISEAPSPPPPRQS